MDEILNPPMATPIIQIYNFDNSDTYNFNNFFP